MKDFKRMDMVSNSDLRKLTKPTDIFERIEQQKWRWAGHDIMRDKIEKIRQKCYKMVSKGCQKETRKTTHNMGRRN